MKKNMLKLLAFVTVLGAIGLTTTLAIGGGNWGESDYPSIGGGRNSGPTCISCSIRP